MVDLAHKTTLAHTRVVAGACFAPFAKVLRKVEILKSLNSKQIRRLADVLTEETFGDGNYIVRQGDVGNSFYIIRDGNAVVTLKDDLTDTAEIPREVMRLSENQYFGERALLHDQPRAANVIAVGQVKCLHIERHRFNEALGHLKDIIDHHRSRRERNCT